MTDQKVLIVEDNIKIAELLRDYLILSNFEVSMLNTGIGVIDAVQDSRPDAIILDLVLPGRDGLAICKEIRSFSNVPILMLTAKTEEVDRLLGLDMGADHYICKPFSPREVIARINLI